MTDYVYDEECYPNYFSAGYINVDDPSERYYFEISHRRNDAVAYSGFLFWLGQNGHRSAGYNNISYDYVLAHAIAINPHYHTAASIYDISDGIFKSSKEERFKNTIWPDDRVCIQVDLLLIHHFNNINRRTSLKDLELAMRMDNVQDLPYAPGTVLTEQQMDDIASYMWNDIDATVRFYHETADQLAFREELNQKYPNKDFTNFNDTKIGKEFFIMKLEETQKGICWDYSSGRKQPRQTHRNEMPVKDIIFPYIQFENPEFQRIHGYLLTQTIVNTKKGFEDANCTIDGFSYHLGMGGIHGSVVSRVLHSDEQRIVIDIDVASYYPSLAIANRIFPEHLSEVFCDINKQLFDERSLYDKTNAINKMLKLALNGVYGDSNSPYGPFYDPMYTMKITINGQLLLCMLAEQLVKIPSLEMIQINTDGITMVVDRQYEQSVTNTTEWWENFTQLELERNDYSRMFVRDVNSYTAEKFDGSVKHIGAYKYDVGWHQDHSHLVVPKAVEAYLIHGTPIETFIRGHQDLFDFCGRAKVPRNSQLVAVYNGVDYLQQRISRYYVGIDGVSLVKIMPTTKKQRDQDPDKLTKRLSVAPVTGWKCRIVNNIHDFDWAQLNYEFYIQQANKLIEGM
jgi:uncharacterized protein YkvS